MSLSVVQISWESTLSNKKTELESCVYISNWLCQFMRWFTNTSMPLGSINGCNNNTLLKGYFMAFMKLNTHWWIMKYLTNHMSKWILFWGVWKMLRNNVADKKIIIRIFLALMKFTFWWRWQINKTQLQSDLRTAKIKVSANIYEDADSMFPSSTDIPFTLLVTTFTIFSSQIPNICQPSPSGSW